MFCGHMTCEVKMRQIIEVSTDRLKLGADKAVLRSLAAGCSIAVAACDCQARSGAMTHITLPGGMPEKSPRTNRYAANAV
jgi:chemotaxis receptor (MCP) glutamine deamidase CheD